MEGQYKAWMPTNSLRIRALPFSDCTSSSSSHPKARRNFQFPSAPCLVHWCITSFWSPYFPWLLKRLISSSSKSLCWEPKSTTLSWKLFYSPGVSIYTKDNRIGVDPLWISATYFVKFSFHSCAVHYSFLFCSWLSQLCERFLVSCGWYFLCQAFFSELLTLVQTALGLLIWHSTWCL